MVLPMTCYMASEFAFLTMLMKNSLIEEIKKEYMRTALVKERRSTRPSGSTLSGIPSFPSQRA